MEKRMRKKTSSAIILCVLALVLFAPPLFAQQGTLRGKIIDSTSGDPVFGAGVIIQGKGAFGQTDFDGNYSIAVDPGEYEVIIRMAGYSDQKRSVKIEAGRATSLNITLGLTQAQTVTVEARALNNTEASMLNLQRKSGAVSDGISQEAIRRSPDASAGDALKRVTGISIIGGRYVFVRGLGERYSNTMLNDAPLPSPEPDRRVVPMDLFPASLIKNIRVMKTFLPEDPAEFSGGLVKIETQEYPDEFMMTIGFGLGGNYNTTGRTFQTYHGGRQDFIGRDDGSRAIPGVVDAIPPAIPFVKGNIFGGIPVNYTQLGGTQFGNHWDTYGKRADPDQDIKFTIGNTFNFSNGMKLGFVFGTSYVHKFQTTEYTDNRYGNLSFLPGIGQTSLLAPFQSETSRRYMENVLWGNNLNFALQLATGHEIYSKSFYSTNSDKYSRFSNGIINVEDRRYNAQTTGWIERNIFQEVVGGKHAFNFGSQPHKLLWNYSYAQADRNEPDLDQQLWVKQASGSIFDLPVRSRSADNGTRYYSTTVDTMRTLSASYEIPFTQWNGLASKFKLGFLDQTRQKNFDSRRFLYRNSLSGNETDFYPVPGGISFNPAQIVSGKYIFEEQTGEKNSFDARQNLRAYFGQFDMPLFSKFRFVGGARYEDSLQYIVTYDRYNRGTPELDITHPGIGRLQKKDILPSANFVWEYNDQMNIRAGYTETLARPDLRELSNFGFTPYFNGERLFGNPDLSRTYIHNYDLRWEWYLPADNYVAVGGFYKLLSHPIESIGVLSSGGFGQDFTFANANNGVIKGIEVELRKYLTDRLGAELNLFFIRSEVEVMSWSDRELIRIGFVDPRSSRALYNPTNLSRPLQGQSPYVYNMKLSYYFTQDKKTSASLLYNVFGDRLYSVGTAGFPDTIEKSAGILDAVFQSAIGEKFDLKFTAKNILDTRFKVVQESQLTGTENLYRSYRLGPSFMASLAYKF